MDLSSLHIFSKNRDAYAAQRGYSFQHLATLKVWLANRIAVSDAVIYCDYQDDIFITNKAATIASFKQIKLYSDNFSFSSEEIRTALINFFMLFVKGDYVHHSMNFRFETNTNVARKKGNNAADVLLNWLDEQGKMSEETKVSVRIQVKEILAEYVEVEFAKAKNTDAHYTSVQQAKSVFDQMQDTDFDKFISCISWQFDGNTPERAMQILKEEVTDLVNQLPIVIDQNPSTIVAVLGQAVRDASEQENPELRRLDSQKIDSILLAIGDEKQNWYNQVHTFWTGTEGMIAFNQGAFQEVIDATRYCRYELPGSGHNVFWIELLQQFIDLYDIDTPSKRKAIYEQVFIALDPMLMKPEFGLDFSHYEENIRFYFENWLVGENPSTVDDDITLLQIAEILMSLHNIGITKDDISKWRATVNDWIDENLAEADTVDKKCNFLQLKGHSVFHGSIDDTTDHISKGLDYYRQILPLLSEAKLYSIEDLYYQLDKLIEIVLANSSDSAVVDIVYAFMEELKPHADVAHQGFLTGQAAVRQGARFLKAGGKANVLKALKLFHQARLAYFREDLIEGHLLVLLNLSQVYGMLGMHLASKKYALATVYHSWQHSDPTHYKSIVSATQFLFHSDFKVGAWITALSTFQLLLKTVSEFEPLLLERGGNDFLLRNFAEVALICDSQPTICPVLQHYMDHLKAEMGAWWKDWILPQIAQFKSAGLPGEKLIQLITRKVSQTPFSDVGPERHIRFNALGIDWKIRFANTHTASSIGEEFTALLQVILAEFAAHSIGILHQGKVVEIEVLKGADISSPVLIASNIWQMTIPHFDSKDKKEIDLLNAQLYAGTMMILQSLSIDKAVFKQDSFRLMMDEHLSEKAFCVNTYQKMYAHCYDENVATNSGKQYFASLVLPEFPMFFKTAI